MSVKRALVVDDDRDMVETLCDILELHGWETLRGFDGAAAIDIIQERDVEVVLVDVRMPRIDGVTALREIRRMRPSTRVVQMTAFAAPQILHKAEEYGALRIVDKPVEIPDFIATLDEAFAQARRVLVVDDEPA